MELRKSSSTRRRLATPVRLCVAAVAACFIASPAHPNPLNPRVVSGTAAFTQAGSVLTVTNSPGAIINWEKFSIRAGETTHFAQTSASSTVLNRVLNDPTAIYGTLGSNGRVWLVNPAGIFVGPGGRIDAAGFVASTLNISNENFLAGRKLFDTTLGAGNVINQGEIRTPAGGSVYLIGSNVGNEGIVLTPQGETVLAAGATVSLIDSATPGVKVDITGAAGNATNLGEITAEAGRIGIAGVIVRNSGQINASSVVSEGGRVFLKASQDAYVDKAGRIVTTGTKGGRVEVLGSRVAVTDQAEIDASGANGGGQILVGGDYQGKNPDVTNAGVTYFGPDARLKADATDRGDGGKVIVWADDTARAFGSISAKGGANGGDGGLAETSGKRFLDVAGIRVDSSAAKGSTGIWLLDPDQIVVYGGAGTDIPSGGSYNSAGPGYFSGPVDMFYGGTGVATLYGDNIASHLATTNVELQTSVGGGGGNGSIIVYGGTGAISTGSQNRLSLFAYGGGTYNGNIGFYGANIDIGGPLSLFAGCGSSCLNPGVGSIYIDGATSIKGSSPGSDGTSFSGKTATWRAGGDITVAYGAKISGYTGNSLDLYLDAPHGQIQMNGGVNSYGGLVVFSAANGITVGDGVNTTLVGINARRDGVSGSQLFDSAGYGGRILLDADSDRNGSGTLSLSYGAGIGTTSNAHLFNSSGSFNPYGSVAIGIIAADLSISSGATIKLNYDATATPGAPYGGGDIGILPTTGGTIALGNLGGYGGAGNFRLDNPELTRIFLPSGSSCGTSSEGCRIWIGKSPGAPTDPTFLPLPATTQAIVADQADFSLNGASLTGKRVQLNTSQTINDAGTGAYGGYFGIKAGSLGVGSTQTLGVGNLDADGLSVITNMLGVSSQYGATVTSVGGNDLALRGINAYGGAFSLTAQNGAITVLPSFSSQAQSAYGNFSLIASGDIRLANQGQSYTLTAAIGNPFTETPPVSAKIRVANGTLNLNSSGGSILVAGDHVANGGMTLFANNGISVTDGGLATYGAMTLTTYGDLTLTGNTRGTIVKSAGAMTVSAANVFAYGGSGVNSGAPGSNTTKAFYGSSVLEDVSGYGAGAFIKSQSNVNVTATGSVVLQGGSAGTAYYGDGFYGGSAAIMSEGTQTITARNITLQAGASGHDNLAMLWAYGDQIVSVGNGGAGTLAIYGGGSIGSSNNFAGIEHGDEDMGNRTGSGNQTINLTNGSALLMVGGAGTGNLGDSEGGCSPSCFTSNNFAGIGNHSGGTTITTTGTGSSITLVGGGAAGDYGYNGARLESYGGVTIGSSANRIGTVILTGGNAGGQLGFDGSGKPNQVDNGAGISTENNGAGNLTIYAGSISLNGGSANYGGAYIGGGSQVTIDTTGNLTLTGGSGTNQTGYGDLKWIADSAAIGSQEHSPTINLNVGGNLILTGGSGSGSMAMIGSIASAAAVNIHSAGNVSVTSNTGSAGIGSLYGYGGFVNVTAGQDIAFGNNIGVTGSTVYGAMNLTLLAQRDIALGQASHDLYGGNLSLMAGWDGNTISPALATGAVPGGGYGGSIALTGTNLITRGTGTMAVSAYGALTIAATSTGNASLNNAGAGAMTVLARDITLTGAYGGSAFIGMDGAGTQTVTATNALTLNGAASRAGLNMGNALIRGNFIGSVLGTQHISAHQITLNAGGSGGPGSKDGNYVFIRGSGTQTIDITGSNGGIALYGGGAGTSGGSDNFAQIWQSAAYGSQTINLNGGATVAVFGGSGNGVNGGLGSCNGDANCGTGHPASNNSAGILSAGTSAYGGLTLNFVSGGALTLQGGSNGVKNNAYISNFGTATGSQQILGAPVITLTGGTSGGDAVTAVDGNRYLVNSASIWAPSGAQSISAASLTLNGAGAGASAGANADAWVGGQSQTINVTGAIALNAGATAHSPVGIQSLGNQTITAASLDLLAGSDGHGNKAVVIGNGIQTVTLTGTGNVLTMTGGSGASTYDNYAQVQQLAAGGTQTISLTNAGGGNVVITGGSGGGTAASAPAGCAAAVPGDPCYGAAIAHNNAGLYSGGSGGQTLAFGYGGGLSMYGGSVGNQNNAFILNIYGGQTIAGNAALTLVGGTSGGAWVPRPDIGSYLSNSAGIRSEATATAQTIYGSSITMAGGAGIGGAGISSAATSGQSITVTGAVSLTGGSGSYGGTTLFAYGGPQTLSAQSLALAGGAGGHDNAAAVESNWNQSITLYGGGDALTLTGGSGAGAYNNGAFVRAGSMGGQQIALYGAGANVVLHGGSGNGVLGQPESGCVNAIDAAACAASNNRVAIENNGNMGQTIAFYGGSGSLQIYGGATGLRNSASIENSNDMLRVGFQQILGNPDIQIRGGSSGGRMILATASGEPYFSANEAAIFSDANQTINAASLTMVGGSGASTVSPAVISSSGQSNINITGTILLQGGNGSAASVAYGGSIAPVAPWSQIATGVVIGVSDSAKADITIKANSISAYGGSGTSGAVMIGSMTYGANVSMGAYGDIVLQANSGAVSIGSSATTAPTTYGGVAIQIGADRDLIIDALGSGQLGIGASAIQAIDTASVGLYGGRNLSINGSGSGSVQIGTSTAITPVSLVAGASSVPVTGTFSPTNYGSLTLGTGSTLSAYGSSAGISAYGSSLTGGNVTQTGGAIYGGSINMSASRDVSLAGRLQSSSSGLQSLSVTAGNGMPGGYGGDLTLNSATMSGVGTVTLSASNATGAQGNIIQTGSGSITSTAGDVYVRAGRDVSLVSPVNSAGQIDVQAGTALGGSAANGYGGNIAVSGDIIDGPSPGVYLRAYRGLSKAGTINQSAGTIYGSTVNIIGDSDVTLSGTVTASANALTATAGDGSYGANLFLNGSVLAGYGGVTLSAHNATGGQGIINQTGGSIASGGMSVTIRSGGSTTLAGPVNSASTVDILAGVDAMGSTLIGNGYGGRLSVGGTITSGSDINLVARGGSNPSSGAFANYGGSSALVAGTRWRVFSDDPGGYYGGGLIPGFREYSASGLGSAYGGIGNGVLFSVNPAVASLSLSGTTAKQYDRTTAVTDTSSLSVVAGTAYGDSYSVSATYQFDDWNAGTGKGVTAMIGAIMPGPIFTSGVPVYGLGSGSFTGVTSTSATIGTITPAPLTVTAVTDSRVYNGTTVSSVAPMLSGTTYDAVQTAALQSFDSRNAGTGKTLTASGLLINDGNGGNNYTISYVTNTSGAISAAPLMVSTGAVTKQYTGALDMVGATGQGAVVVGGTLYSGDSLSGGTFAYTDKNVGLGTKTVTVNGVTVGDGTNFGNYNVSYQSNAASTITQLASVNWVGGTSGNWSSAANWTGGAIPDGANVAAVTIGSGKTVTFDGANPATTLTSLSSTGASLIVSGSSLGVNSSVTLANFQQGAGNFSSGGLNITQSFSQLTGAGVLQLSGQLDINQNSVAGSLTVKHGAPLSLGTITVGSGNFNLDNTGGVTTGSSPIGVPNGSASLTARSPITIGSGGISAGNGVTLSAPTANSGSTITVGGAVSGGTGAVALNSYGTITQNANVSGSSISLNSTGGNVALSPGVTNTVPAGGAIVVAASPTNGTVTSSPSNFSGATPTVTDGSGTIAATSTATNTSTTVNTITTALNTVTSGLSDAGSTTPVLAPATDTSSSSTSSSSSTTTSSSSSSTSTSSGTTSGTTSTTTTTTTTSAPPPIPTGYTLGGSTGTFGSDSGTTTTIAMAPTTISTTSTTTAPTTTPSSGTTSPVAPTTTTSTSTGDTGSGSSSTTSTSSTSTTTGTTSGTSSGGTSSTGETGSSSTSSSSTGSGTSSAQTSSGDKPASETKKDEGTGSKAAPKDEKKDTKPEAKKEEAKDEKKDAKADDKKDDKDKKDEKDKKDKKKSDDEKDGKKDEKPAQKKVAQCS